MKQIQKGFTLIELMIVVAIIGILAAVAIPAYQDYVVKAKLSKVVTSMDPIKTAIAMYYQENGSFPVEATANVVGTTVTGATWSSLGLTSVTLPPELSRIDYNGAADNYGLSFTFATGKVKANTIDGQSVVLGPVTGNTVAAGGAITLAVSGVGGSATALPVYYACSAQMDNIARKFFNNSGANCP
ncbi:fimbrial protein precursor [mine drainage metagenome]|uniref:Fimbrial protein n=1 Tax=mine drainage metagenome TaxID=410659 RepID=A0A1J5T5F1_9ZZZZ